MAKKDISNKLGSAFSGVTGILEAAMANARIKNTSEEEAVINDVAQTEFSSGSLDNLSTQFDQEDLSKSNYTQEEVRGVSNGQKIGNILKGTASGVVAGAKTGDVWGAIGGGLLGLGTSIGGMFVGDARARSKATALNRDANIANNAYLNNYSNAVDSTQNKMFNNSLLNMAAYGGPLFNFTGDFTNGITFINAGGTHEQNPLGGVPMGVDKNGTPNLVEEGEAVYKDYVFSNRLKPTKKQVKDAGFKDKYIGYTFAEIVKDINKSYADTPVDPISKVGLEDMMNRVISMQEVTRQNKKNKSNNIFAYGGYSFYGDDEELKRRFNEALARQLLGLDDENTGGTTSSTNNTTESSNSESKLPPRRDSLGLPGMQLSTRRILDNELNTAIADLAGILTQPTSTTNKEVLNTNNAEQTEQNPNNTTTTDTPVVKEQTVQESPVQKQEEVTQVTPVVTQEKVETESKTKTPKLDMAQPNTDKKTGTSDHTDDYSDLFKSSFSDYLSPLIQAGALVNNLKKPDYSNAMRIEKAGMNIPRGSFTPLGNYIDIPDISRSSYVNPILSTSRSTARAMQNQGLNSGVMGSLLSLQHNTNNSIGEALTNYNQTLLNNRVQEATFNRGTDQANAQMGLQALGMDQQAALSRLNAIQAGAQLRDKYDASRSAAIASNIKGITDDFMNINRYNKDRRLVQWVKERGV